MRVLIKQSKQIVTIATTPTDKSEIVMIQQGSAVIPYKISELEQIMVESKKKFEEDARVKVIEKGFLRYGNVRLKDAKKGEVNVYIHNMGTFAYPEAAVTPMGGLHQIMWINAIAEIQLAGKKVRGVVTRFSDGLNPSVNITLPDKSTFDILKEHVKIISPMEASITYFKDIKDAKVIEHHMADLFTAQTHTEVVNLGIEGVVMEDFDVYFVNDKVASWYAAVPKGLKKGDKIPCLIAHTDLHPALKHPTAENLEYTDGIFKSATGLGADDRAGVFAINQLLKEHSGDFMFLFPDKEEVGCLGSGAFGKHKDFSKIDDYASVYISIDRRREYNGDKTLATYSKNNTVLNTAIGKLTDRKIVRGSSTDCATLSRLSKNKVPCFNMSCGYTGEHTKSETLRFKELIDTVDDLKDMMLEGNLLFTENKVDVVKPYSYKPSTKKTSYYDDLGLYDMLEVDGEWFDEADVQAMMDVYAYYTGQDYDTKAPIMIPEVSKGNLMKVDMTMIAGQIYGGQQYTPHLSKTLRAHEWEVESINLAGQLTLKAKTITCSKIPRRWMTLILDDEPLIN